MMFFFKNKPIELVCVSNSLSVLEYAPVKKAIKFIPQWWKNLPRSLKTPNSIHEWPTMKNCAGFVDHYSYGAVIPLWCDLALRIGPKGTTSYQYQFSDKTSSLSHHASCQHGNHYNPHEYQHLKIDSPWVFGCKEDIKFLFTEPTWSFINFKNVRVLPGSLSFKYQSSTNINLMIHKNDTEQDILLPFLEPMAHIIPLSDRPLKLILSNDTKLYDSIASKNYITTFTNRYRINLVVQKEKNKTI